MAQFQTERFGRISFEPDATLDFPRGLPGFEHLRQFVALQLPGSEPLVFLQSLEDAALCFVTAPVSAVEPSYRLAMNAEDLEVVGLPRGRPPAIGRDVLCLAVLAFREDETSANLLAPIVVNLRSRRAVQAISPEAVYSHRRSLAPEEAAVCS